MADFLLLVAVLAGAFLLGVVLILRVPPRLHTPLMSMTNAVSGITVLGALVLLSEALDAVQTWLVAVSVVFGAVNLVGGFAVTDRMLRLFKSGGSSDG